MTERPILFSGPMVRAILAGQKTQTRRAAIKTSQPRNVYISDFDAEEVKIEIENKHSGQRYWKQCPFGIPGDRLWVRESGWERPERTAKMMREGADTWPRYAYAADNWSDQDRDDFKAWGFKPRPSIHMPRWASRILLEITCVRVERLQEISEADALAEGIESLTGDKTIYHWDFPKPRPKHAVSGYKSAQSAYKELWAELNGRESLDDNPFVWVVEFKRLEGGAACN